MRPYAYSFAFVSAAFASAVLLSSSAIAEDKIWVGREGVCSDWSVVWTVQETTNGHYTGTIAQDHQGIACGASFPTHLTGTVEADISDSTITAVVTHSDGNICNYKGTIDRYNKVENGIQNCPNAKDKDWSMTIIP